VVARGARKVIAPILRSASKIRHIKIDGFPQEMFSEARAPWPIHVIMRTGRNCR
jgi:hypothetical protein